MLCGDGSILHMNSESCIYHYTWSFTTSNVRKIYSIFPEHCIQQAAMPTYYTIKGYPVFFFRTPQSRGVSKLRPFPSLYPANGALFLPMICYEYSNHQRSTITLTNTNDGAQLLTTDPEATFILTNAGSRTFSTLTGHNSTPLKSKRTVDRPFACKVWRPPDSKDPFLPPYRHC